MVGSEHRRGLLLTSLGVAAIIPDATFVRLVDASSMTNAMWRTGLLGISLGVFLAARYRGDLLGVLRSLGGWGVVASVRQAKNPPHAVVGTMSRCLFVRMMVKLAESPIEQQSANKFPSLSRPPDVPPTATVTLLERRAWKVGSVEEQ